MLRLLTKWCSAFIGLLARIPLPSPFNIYLVNFFVNKAGVDLTDVRDPIESFRSLSEFFIRELKPGARAIDGTLISPVDGMLRDSGQITNGTLEHIKGSSYSLREFVGNDLLASKCMNGWYWNFYLSPRDYHRVHVPVSGVVRSIHKIPGRLLPVNDWSMKSFKDLFPRNERVIVEIESKEYGTVVAVLVGALNVGSISIFVNPSQNVTVGEQLGAFNLGSTVVVIASKAKRSWGTKEKTPSTMGQSLEK